MILVAGGTGHLGTELIPRLVARGLQVRVLTREPIRARELLGAAAEVVRGDVSDPSSLKVPMEGVRVVISAITGFGPGGPGPRAVDYAGNLNMIRAAEASGVDRFVLLSMRGAGADHPMELLREKYRAEEALRASHLSWTIVRPTVFMELWIGIIGDPVVKTGKTTIFGPGTNPVNFVSVRDVTTVIELALTESAFGRRAVDVGGPDNLTMNEVVREVEESSGRQARVRHVPLPLMRLSRLLMRPIRPDLAGLIEAGLAMATTDMTFDPKTLWNQLPEMELAHVADVVHSRFQREHEGPASA